MDTSLPVVAVTLHVESSPQALPLGAACIASSIKHASFFAGIPVLLKDFTMEDREFSGLSSETIGNRIGTALASERPCAVCFSVYVWNRTALESAAATLRNLLPDCLLVAGGTEVTAQPQSFSVFDYTVAGEGEEAVPLLLEAVLSGSLAAGDNCGIAGVYAACGKTLPPAAVQRTKLPAPDTLSSPYLDGTLDPARYGGALWELARGCPFSCSYCYESKGEKTVRRFPLERLRKELQLFARAEIAQVFVLDPTYNADRQRAIDILQMIKKLAPDIYFNFEVRAEFIDRELARLFAAIPCSLQIGLQSADEKVLANVNRTFNRKEFTKKIGILNNEGVIFGFDLIFGLPGDTWNGFLSSIDFAVNLYPNHLDIFRLAVLPGTALHDTAPASGLQWNPAPPYTVIASPGFSPEQLRTAEQLAGACCLFYSKGRAVSWFLAVLRPLKIKPSSFFIEFSLYLAQQQPCSAGSDLSHREIEKMQLSFLYRKYKEKKLLPLWDAVEDLVKMNGALCRALAEQETTDIDFHWHPEDILGGDALDISLFVQEVCRESGTVRIFPGKEGPDFRILA